MIVDTPGQIEIFTWSASGAIITDAVASALPTVVAYIVDTPRTIAPATFMSNMLYACRYVVIATPFFVACVVGGTGCLLRHPQICVSLEMLYSTHLPCSEHDSCPTLSILYKTKLPFIIVFNKTDVQPHDFALEWMQDFEVFQEALATHQSTTDDDGEPTYMNSLMNSMSLVLDEFYKHLKVGSRWFSIWPSGLTFPVSWRIQYDRRRCRRVLPSRRGFARGIRKVHTLALVFAVGHLTCPSLRTGNISLSLLAYVRSGNRRCRNKKRTLQRGCWPTLRWTAQVTPTLQRETVGIPMRRKKKRKRTVGS